MGKKNKKSRRGYDDDDLLGLPPTAEGESPDREETGAVDVDTAVPTAKKNDEAARGDANVDPAKLEETIEGLYRKNPDKPEDWLIRTAEKNLRLPKHSLRERFRGTDDVAIILERVQHKLESEYDEECEREGMWDTLMELMGEKDELTEADEAMLRADATRAGIDPEEIVAAAKEAIQARKVELEEKGDVDEGDEGAEGDDGVDLDKVPGGPTPSMSILGMLQPRLLPPPPGSPPAARLFSAVQRYICLILYTLLLLVLGEKPKKWAERRLEKLRSIRRDALAAEEAAREREEDRRMVDGNAHLWSDRQQSWIEKDRRYAPPDGPGPFEAPPTVRWNGDRGQWERWSKNLTTKTRASRRAEEEGRTPPPFSRGTFLPARAGEGWATAPDQPETEKEGVVAGGVRFLACLPVGGDDDALEVADVTSWAAKTLVTKEAARELEAVDSGRELFSFDVSSMMTGKRGGKKAKAGKKKKKPRNADGDGAGGEEDEANSVERKGIGFSAKVNKKYLDKL